jgi:hypothetical protein
MTINWNNRKERQYLLLTCHNYSTEPEVISKEQKSNLNTNKVDVFLDLTKSTGFIKPQKGKRILDPVFGPEVWELLEKLIEIGGECLRLESQNHVAAKIWRLRKIFKDKHQYFFVTQRHPYYAVKLNPQRTWQIIMEYVPQQED